MVNAGCWITIRSLLGHHRRNATMAYARVHDQTVADDYYRAMTVIAEELDGGLEQVDFGQNARHGASSPSSPIPILCFPC